MEREFLLLESENVLRLSLLQESIFYWYIYFKVFISSQAKKGMMKIKKERNQDLN